MKSQALVPIALSHTGNKILSEALSLICGVVLLSLLAQITIPLPWTPVPITGQTFGVALVALSWGRKRALSIFIAYLAVGAIGLPVFALGKSGLAIGPTFGYLVGMMIASFVVGTLADLGFTKSFWRSLLAAYLGSLCIFTCGLIGLSLFVPSEALLMAGLIPFLPGDIIKNSLAAFLSWKLRQLSK